MQKKEKVTEVDGLESVVIVRCRICPAASAAVRSDAPYIDFPRNSLKTASHERLITRMKSDLEDLGIGADGFKSHLVHQFVLCMWTSNRRKLSKEYDALVVMGCEAAVDTVRDAVKSTGCR